MGFLDRLFGLGGKTALVTGGATGLGRMGAEALVRAGARVLLVSRKGEACVAAAHELNGLGATGSAEGFAGDAGTEDGVRALVAAVTSRTDRLHILFNNAGKTWGEPMDSFPFKAWESVMALNVAGLFSLTRDLLPLLEKAGTADDPARVVNVGSVMGSVPIGQGAYSYAASKAAVHHLTKILATELARRHVTVNALAPGPFETRMTAFSLGTPEGKARAADNTPLGRVGREEDIMGALLYLCGGGGAYITGAVLPIDGGKSVHAGARLLGTSAERD